PENRDHETQFPTYLKDSDSTPTQKTNQTMSTADGDKPGSTPTAEADPQSATLSRTSQKRSRYVPLNVKKSVLKRDQYRCQYRDQRTGVQCTAQTFLQLDHVKRFRDGGSNTKDNLRALCAQHNRWRG